MVAFLDAGNTVQSVTRKGMIQERLVTLGVKEDGQPGGGGPSQYTVPIQYDTGTPTS